MIRFRMIFAVVALSCFSLISRAEIAFQENIHYRDVAPDVPANNLAKSVTGFFWYGCSHCYRFEPSLEAWLVNKPRDISFKRVPAVLARNWVVHAQAFYAAEELGIDKKTHQALFDAIHRQQQPLFEATDIAEFLAKASNESAAKILVHMKSPYTRQGVSNSIAAARKYRLRGVPAVLVGEKYLLDLSVVGDDFGAAIEFLLSR